MPQKSGAAGEEERISLGITTSKASKALGWRSIYRSHCPKKPTGNLGKPIYSRYWFSSQSESWRDVLETLLRARGLVLLSSYAEMNGNRVSCLLPLPLLVKMPVNASCSHNPPSARSGFHSEDTQRTALVSLMVPTTWRARSTSTEVRSWPRKLQCHMGGCCHSRGPCKTESKTSGCCPSGPSAFCGRERDCHLLSMANTQPVNAPFFPVTQFSFISC